MMARPGRGLSPGERGARYSAAPGHSARDGRKKQIDDHIYNGKCIGGLSEIMKIKSHGLMIFNCHLIREYTDGSDQSC